MSMISNIHTHSCYCDGKNTPEEMVQAALAQGLTALGFSGHSYTPFDSYCPGMSPEKVQAYRTEIARLAKKYEGRIRLYTAIEMDSFTEPDSLSWDYRIGSIHFTHGQGRYYAIDGDAMTFQASLQDLFQNQFSLFLEDYLRRELEMFRTMKPEVIGHFDLYRKNNQALHYLDEEDPAYLSMVQDTLYTLIRQDALFEVNLGAMARGYMTDPYPAEPLLRFMQKEKARVIITTDCHDARYLTFHYDETVQYLKALGFPSMVVMGTDGWEEHPL